MAVECDVLVVGAGPAGSSAAKAAAMGGVKTIFIDIKESDIFFILMIIFPLILLPFGFIPLIIGFLLLQNLISVCLIVCFLKFFIIH